jgi:hypothetical protein
MLSERTEEDLRDAFTHLADQAPHPADIRTQLQTRRPRRSRRTTLAVGAALATATAAVAAAVVPALISADSTGVAGQEKRNTAWSRWVDLNLPVEIEAVGQVFTANRQNYELVDVVHQIWPTTCQLQLRRNGDFDPATIPASSPRTDIGGHPARVVASTRSKPFLAAPQGYRFPLYAAVQKNLVWQPVDGVWALLSCESQRRLGTVQLPTIDGPIDTNLALATKLARNFSPPTRSLGSPVKIGWLPAGISPRRVNYLPNEKGIPGSGESLTVLLSDGNPATGAKPRGPSRSQSHGGSPRQVPGSAWGPDRGDDLQLRYSTDKFWNQLSRDPEHNQPIATIHGMKAYFFAGQLANMAGAAKPGTPSTLRLEGNGVGVEIVDLDAKPSKERLLRIVESLQLTKTPNQPSSWFDAATAIP